jgi:hypothetical protein
MSNSNNTHFIPVTFMVKGAKDRNEAAAQILAALEVGMEGSDLPITATPTTVITDGVSAERMAKAQAIAVALIVKSQDLPKQIALGAKAVKPASKTPTADDVINGAEAAFNDCQICGSNGTHFCEDAHGKAWFLCDDCHNPSN